MNITTDEFIVLCGSPRLVRDSRYACDCCEALTHIKDLTQNEAGFFCGKCEDDRVFMDYCADGSYQGGY